MPKIDLMGIPSNVHGQRLNEKAFSLEKMTFFASVEKVTLCYLGGITNHGLKDDERNLFVRIPGQNSALLVDRDAELDTLTKLATHGLYPPVIEAYSKGELAGYKIEHFIEGETLQFDTFHLHQAVVLPTLKELHDSNIQFVNEFNIFTRLNVMLETLRFNEIDTIPYFNAEHLLLSMPLDSIKPYIDELQGKMASLFPYQIALSRVLAVKLRN